MCFQYSPDLPSCHWKAPALTRNVKFKFSGFTGIIDGLFELFLDHFDLLGALTKPMQLVEKQGEGE